MAWKRFIYMHLLLSYTYILTEEKLIVFPRDIVTKVNQTTYLNCSTTLKSEEIFWLHGKNYVYAENTILRPYDARFTTEHNNGSCNLVIHSVEPGDAGEYTCSEEDFEEKPSAQLIVIDNDPICQSNKNLDEVIWENKCNLEPDEVELSCSVAFHGSRPPAMAWKKVGDNKAITEGLFHTLSSNIYSITLKLKGEAGLSPDDSAYVCETTEGTPSPFKCKLTIKGAVHHDGMGTEKYAVMAHADDDTETTSHSFFIVAGVVIGLLSIMLLVATLMLLQRREQNKRFGHFIETEVRNDLTSHNIANDELNNMIEKWNRDIGFSVLCDIQKSTSCQSQTRSKIVNS